MQGETKKQKPMVETNNRRFLGAEAEQQRRHRCCVRANKSQAICRAFQSRQTQGRCPCHRTGRKGKGTGRLEGSVNNKTNLEGNKQSLSK